jgi:hypothetical protein
LRCRALASILGPGSPRHRRAVEEAEVTVAIIGWGSLLWDPRTLVHDGSWRPNGPVLPLEFSRRSSGGRLTLVVDHDHGVPCTTYWTSSTHGDVDEVIDDLAVRETTTNRWVGLVDRRTGQAHGRDAATVRAVREWSAAHDLSAAVWTDLPGNFERHVGLPFSVPAAIEHLEELTEPDRTTARRYLQNAPAAVRTRLRSQLHTLSWWDHDPSLEEARR